MVDIHCHLLPNVDDGPKSWDESVEMARIASGDGIKVSITTPHWIQGTNWEPETDRIRELVAELNTRLEQNSIPLKVLPGMEIGITANLPELLANGDIITLGEGKYLLLEIPHYTLPYGLEDIIFSLESQGTKVVLAHPERNREFQNYPSRILQLTRLGALVQVTAGSLEGLHGRSAKKCAMQLAKLDALHIVASDAHSTTNRPPIVSKGLRSLEDIMGAEYVQGVQSNMNQIVEGVEDTGL